MTRPRHTPTRPHYLRFAQALSLAAGVASAATGCDASHDASADASADATADAGNDASTDAGHDAAADAGNDASTLCTGCTYLRCESGLPPEAGPPLCPSECFVGHDGGGLICGPLAPPSLAAA